MLRDTASLPDDLAAAHAMLRAERAARHSAETQLAERDAAITRQAGEVAALRFEIERLKLLLAKARRERYGCSSERGAKLRTTRVAADPSRRVRRPKRSAAITC